MRSGLNDMDENKANKVSHTDDETLKSVLEKLRKNAKIKREESIKKEQKTRYKDRILFLTIAGVVLALLSIIVTILLKETGPEPPVLDSNLHSYYDFEEIYFRVGQSLLEEGYADKVLSLLDRIPGGMNTQNDQEQQCQILIICSGDSRGDPDLTKEISDKRACEVKRQIARKVKGINKERWKRAKLWSFGTTVTPGFRREGGEDYNCNCFVIATTDINSTKQRYLDKLRELNPADNLKDYTVNDCDSSDKR